MAALCPLLDLSLPLGVPPNETVRKGPRYVSLGLCLSSTETKQHLERQTLVITIVDLVTGRRWIDIAGREECNRSAHISHVKEAESAEPLSMLPLPLRDAANVINLKP